MNDATARQSRADRGGQLRGVPAMAKVLATLGLVICVAALPSAAGIWAALVIPVILVWVAFARIPIRSWLRGILLGEPFVVGASLLLLLRPGGAMLFVAVIIKATVCLALLQVLVRTTPFPEILGVLRVCRIPAPLLSTVSLLHRFVPVLTDETMRMRRARAARTFDRSQGLSWQTLAAMIGILFVRSTLRAERVDAAMRARGWS